MFRPIAAIAIAFALAGAPAFAQDKGSAAADAKAPTTEAKKAEAKKADAKAEAKPAVEAKKEEKKPRKGGC